MSSVHWDSSMIVIPGTDTALVVGGTDYLGKAEIYDGSIWADRENLPSNLYGITLVAVSEDIVYSIGGRGLDAISIADTYR